MEMTELLKSPTADDMKDCFEQWKMCIQQCIDRNGEYYIK